eukprot:1348867-Alexandrium_andersonii.AAC.1
MLCSDEVGQEAAAWGGKHISQDEAIQVPCGVFAACEQLLNALPRPPCSNGSVNVWGSQPAHDVAPRALRSRGPAFWHEAAPSDR